MDTRLWPTILLSNTSICNLLISLGKADGGKWDRISTRIAVTWGTKECHNYIQSLIFDDRPGGRQGFPLNIAMLIHEISHEHLRFYMPPSDVWSETLMR